MNLDDITAMILTFNEEANIVRTLEALSWASTVLIVDSYSTDHTLELVKQFPNVEVVQRKFDHFADQCNFGLQHIKTSWVLSLDADYVCPASLYSELKSLTLNKVGYRARFRYGIFGHALRASLYPPRTVLYAKEYASYARDGHAHRVQIDGECGELKSAILHDDRKPLCVWLYSQIRYALQEAEKLSSKCDLSWKDRIRKQVLIAPVLTPLYCLFVKGLLFDGRAGLYYTMQRTFAEFMLSLVLLDNMLREHPKNP